jgi:hypothetical protein
MAPQQRMTLAEFRQQLSAYPTNWLICKDTRHTWEMTQTFERQPDGWITRVALCTRCRTRRTDFFELSTSQKRLTKRYSSYNYPAGFGFRGLPDDGALSEVIRYEAFTRALNDNYHEEPTDDE